MVGYSKTIKIESLCRDMEETLRLVHISQKGIVQNILSLNYNHQTTGKEYLNNILDKNVHPEYSINFNMKKLEREQINWMQLVIQPQQ